MEMINSKKSPIVDREIEEYFTRNRLNSMNKKDRVCEFSIPVLS